MTAEAANTIPDIFLDDWPRIQSQVAQDPETEAFIADIVSRMTLEEKVGQMIQPDLREVTPDEVTEYKLGSILNGGGAFPGNNKYATAAEWAETAETFYQASGHAFEARDSYPVRLGDRRGHGHNNVFGADAFPTQHWPGAART